MRRRIYWLLPHLASAEATMADLLQAGVEVRHVHFVAREDFDLTGLHQANVLQTSDVLRAAERGLVIGAAFGGLVGALVAEHYPLVGEAPQWSLAPVLTVVGALFGSWSASMIGVSVPNQRLARFTPKIAGGEILLMVDARPSQVAAIEARLRALHPEARFEGEEPDGLATP